MVLCITSQVYHISGVSHLRCSCLLYMSQVYFYVILPVFFNIAPSFLDPQVDGPLRVGARWRRAEALRLHAPRERAS